MRMDAHMVGETSRPWGRWVALLLLFAVPLIRATASVTGSVGVAAPPSPPPSSGVPTSVITPAGGAFDQSLPVTISGAVAAELLVTSGWRTGVKYPTRIRGVVAGHWTKRGCIGM
jgi:hypothetical protein